MDGMQYALNPPGMASFAVACQSTLKNSIDCVGIGLHSGQRVRMVLRPAAPDHGIVFRRTDLGQAGLGRDIPARFDLVADTRLATVLADPGDPSVRVGTVEHVMAALAGCGIDNALIEIDGPELPALDGSAAHLVFLIDCAGIAPQDAPRRTIEVLRTVRVSDGDAFAELRPARRTPVGTPNLGTNTGLELTMSIAFAAAAIGQQALSLHLTPKSFRQELSRARTFALAEDIDRLRAAGMARGGSLENAVVVDAARVLNPGGLRMHDEFVRHKLLDAVGDLALAGAPLSASFIAHRSGHGLNNLLLRALLGDATAWRMVTDVPVRVAA
jgi:UDP-3-O-[3-hydroxymyristoyl] N-acetylglucosamine deacetylase